MNICGCGDSQCTKEMYVDTQNHSIRFVDHAKDSEVFVYYDANTLVNVIQRLREALLSLTEERK